METEIFLWSILLTAKWRWLLPCLYSGFMLTWWNHSICLCLQFFMLPIWNFSEDESFVFFSCGIYSTCLGWYSVQALNYGFLPWSWFQRKRAPPLVDQSVGELEQKNLSSHKSFNQVLKLVMMVFCPCVDFKRGYNPSFVDQDAFESGHTNCLVHTLGGFIGVLQILMWIHQTELQLGKQ